MAKVSKESVNYGPGHARGDHCGVCAHFEAPHACEIVAGEIDASMWCERFKRKRRGAILYRRKGR